MKDRKLATRYARALFTALPDPHAREAADAFLSALGRAIASSPELELLFLNPAVPRRTKKAVLAKLAQGSGAGKAVASFLAVVVDHGRAGQIPAIAQAFHSVREEAEGIVHAAAMEAEKESGRDYVFLGFTPGSANVILNMGLDLPKTFPKDHFGKPIESLPMMQGIKTLRDVQYAISLGAGSPGCETWYVYGKEKYGFELGCGVTAVSAAGLYPLLQTGQINGLIGGLRGGAEYETLLRRAGKATAGMDAQSATHVLIIVLILLGNVGYLLTRRREAR